MVSKILNEMRGIAHLIWLHDLIDFIEILSHTCRYLTAFTALFHNGLGATYRSMQTVKLRMLICNLEAFYRHTGYTSSSKCTT